MKWIEKIFDAGDRDDRFSIVCDLLDALHWEHYPTNVTGEELDAGNDSDEAREETIEVPENQLDVYDFLDEMGIFDC